MEDIMELGSDFNRNWSFKDGDLLVVSHTDNLIQAIINRLNTILDSMDDFYMGYGSHLMNFRGARRNKEMLDFIKIELETCLMQDPRIQNPKITVENGVNKQVDIYVVIDFDDETDLTLSLIMTEDGVVINGN